MPDNNLTLIALILLLTYDGNVSTTQMLLLLALLSTGRTERLACN